MVGNPDLVFWKARLAVFCDGDFWHGRDWSACQRKLRNGWNADYWVRKIKYNRDRDRQNVALLRRAGWTVIRFWESDIKRTPRAAAQRVLSVIIRNGLA